MARRLLFILLLMAPASALAQLTTAVSAIVSDANGNIYTNCQWSVVFVGENTSPGAGPYAPASLLNSQQAKCDSFGNLSVALADNINTVTPTPSQWQFYICSSSGYPGGPYCFNKLITITGASQSITATLQSAAPILPPFGNVPSAGGNVGQVQLKGSSGILSGGSPIYVNLITGSGNNDIGDKINTAYASCPSSGCTLYVTNGTYNFTTPIVLGVSNKSAVIQCGYGANSFGPTILNYTPTTGNAITLSSGLSSALKGCTLTGSSNSNSAVGLLVSGQTQSTIEQNSVSLFGTCLQIGNNTYLDSFRENQFFNCTKAFNYPNTVTGSGEDLVFYGGLFQGVIGAYSATCFDIEANAETVSLFGVSLDSCGITLNGTGINFLEASGNVENLSSTTTLDFLTIGSSCVQCSATLSGPNYVEDSASGRAHLITNGANGAHLTIDGGKFSFGDNTARAELVNTVSGSVTTVVNPFFNVAPTVVIGGSGANYSVQTGITTSTGYFVINGTAWTAGAGPPTGNCIGGGGIYTNNIPADQNHILFVCGGNVWYKVLGSALP